MKNFIFVAVGCLTLFASCVRYAECTNPRIELNYTLDTTGFLLFTFDKYEKGTSFSKLVSSEPDSAYADTFTYGGSIKAGHLSVDGKNDYIITVHPNGKKYKISDVQYSGATKVKASGTISELRTACTRTVNYTVNGQPFKVDGATYDVESHAARVVPVVTIGN